jgi:cystathionine beta-lyase
MIFDFDRPEGRRESDSVKWGKYAGRDIIPLWVADTDFQSPPAVIDALSRRVAHGVFGYGEAPAELITTVLETCSREWAWEVDPAWLVWLPGLVSGINVTCRAVGKSGEGVGALTPVYPPFLKAPALMDRSLVTIPLGGDNTSGWTIESRRLTAGLADDCSLLLWCHPHNPVGRAWRREELESVAEACLDARTVICSDEIHNQLILSEGVKHVPMAVLGPEVAARTITLLAPSKAFNVAGLGCSVAVIPDDGLRRRFRRAMAGIVPSVNVMGFVAALAAWRDGGEWLAAQNAYLRGNRDFLYEQVAEMAGVTMAPVEATYLAWLDVSGLGLDDPAAYFESHGLGLSGGREFAGAGYVRLNFGCTRATLEEACDRLAKAVAAVG